MILILFMLTDIRKHKNRAINYYRGLQLQKRYAPNDSESFFRIYPERFCYKIREISKMEYSYIRVCKNSKFCKIGSLFLDLKVSISKNQGKMHIRIVKIKCQSRLSISRKSQLPLDLKRIRRILYFNHNESRIFSNAGYRVPFTLTP